MADRCERCGTSEREVERSEELGVTLCGRCFGARANGADELPSLKDRADAILDSMPPHGCSGSQRIEEAVRIAIGTHRAKRYWQDRDQADAEGDDEPEPGGGDDTTWAPVDLAAILAGEDSLEPAPTMLARTDGERLVYAGKVHSFNGEPEAGKGWLALRAVAERLNAGEHVVYINFEDEAPVAVDRLRALDVADDAIRERFHYIRPDEPLDESGRREIERLLEYPITLAVIDGLTDALAIHGIDLREQHRGRQLDARSAAWPAPAGRERDRYRPRHQGLRIARPLRDRRPAQARQG